MPAQQTHTHTHKLRRVLREMKKTTKKTGQFNEHFDRTLKYVSVVVVAAVVLHDELFVLVCVYSTFEYRRHRRRRCLQNGAH